MQNPLLVVDVQVGFINQFTRHVPDRVARLVERGEYDQLLFTRFVNTPGSPYQRLLDWHDCERPPDTDLAPDLQRAATTGLVFPKLGFTGLPDALAAYLRDNRVARLTLVGIDTDMCVLKCAMDVFDLGIEPIVLTDCCASTAGLQAHFAGLAILSRNIGPYQLRETGLGGGLLAAPESPRVQSPPEWQPVNAAGEESAETGKESRIPNPESRRAAK